MAWAQTHSGGHVDFADFSQSTYTLDDVARGLASHLRFAGQTIMQRSVAAHSVHVAEVVEQLLARMGFDVVEHPRLVRTALLHDGPEFILGDMITPAKDHMPDYQRLEKSLMADMARRFDVWPTHEGIVKEADHIVLMWERAHMLSPAALKRWHLPQEKADIWRDFNGPSYLGGTVSSDYRAFMKKWKELSE